MFCDELCVSSFPWYVSTVCLNSTVSPLPLCWVKDVCSFRCNLPPALLAEWPVSFTYHCGKVGMEPTLNRGQHRKWALERKSLLPLLPGIKLMTFWSWDWHSTNKLAWLHLNRNSQKHYCKQSKIPFFCDLPAVAYIDAKIMMKIHKDRQGSLFESVGQIRI